MQPMQLKENGCYLCANEPNMDIVRCL